MSVGILLNNISLEFIIKLIFKDFINKRFYRSVLFPCEMLHSRKRQERDKNLNIYAKNVKNKFITLLHCRVRTDFIAYQSVTN